MVDRRKFNAGDSPVSVERDLFARFDELPQKLRQAIAYAPYPYTVGESATYYNALRGAGMEEEQAVNVVYGKFRAMVQRMQKAEALRLYGPDHPQAA